MKYLNKNYYYNSAIWFDIMLVLMASVAGSIDVMSYFKLGHVFTANMTGNTILLGLSVGQGNIASALHQLTALAGFFSGAFLGAYIVQNSRKGWSHYITISIAIETFIIMILVFTWFTGPDIQNNYVLFTSIALSSIAMGIQSATIRHLNIPGVVTTFMTGTITSIGMNAIAGFKKGFKEKVKDGLPGLIITRNLEERIKLQVVIFFAYGLTAVITGWLEFHDSFFLPLLPFVLIICVLIIVIKSPENPHLSKS
ncbi:MAG: YoaK family protein [Ginsengibacter sp.]